MPIIKSAQKAARQTAKRTIHNKAIKKDIKVATKAFVANPTFAAFKKAQSELDKAAKKGLLKKNTAARRKSNLAKIAKAAGVKFTATKKTTAKAGGAKTTTAKKTTVKKAPAKKATVKKTTTKTVAKKPAAKKPAAKKK